MSWKCRTGRKASKASESSTHLKINGFLNHWNFGRISECFPNQTVKSSRIQVKYFFVHLQKALNLECKICNITAEIISTNEKLHKWLPNFRILLEFLGSKFNYGWFAEWGVDINFASSERPRCPEESHQRLQEMVRNHCEQTLLDPISTILEKWIAIKAVWLRFSLAILCIYQVRPKIVFHRDV